MSHVYLDHKLKLGLDNQTAEVKIRIGLGYGQLLENSDRY